MTSYSPILVTGAHRSGTTWVGRMIATSREVGYISEPFNIRRGFTGTRFDHWYTYVTDDNESQYYPYLKRTLSFQYDLLRELIAVDSLGYLWRAPRDYLLSLRHRACDATPLVKDPIAVLSAEWLADRFDMRVVVLIRHPAAFVSSLKVKSWTFPFSHFLEQPLLIRDWLHPFEDQISEYADTEQDIVDQGILLWKIIYHVIAQYRRDHEDWLFLRHEDVSCAPMNHFRRIYEKLNLELSPRVRREIQKYSAPSNPTNEPALGSYFKRDSRSIIRSWKSRLTPSEVCRVRAGVETLSSEFYSDKHW